jgi:hypothetical protein
MAHLLEDWNRHGPDVAQAAMMSARAESLGAHLVCVCVAISRL